MDALRRIPRGYSRGQYGGRRYGTTLTISADEKRVKLYAEELGGTDVVSFNFYRLHGDRGVLKPCEMSARKVLDFLAGYTADSS